MSTCGECRFIAKSQLDDSEYYCTRSLSDVYKGTNACSKFETHPRMITTCKDCQWCAPFSSGYFCAYDNDHKNISGGKWCRHFVKKENAK